MLYARPWTSSRAWGLPNRWRLRSTLPTNRLVASMVGHAAERCGRIDVLVNNAGIQIRRNQPQDYSLAEWHRILDTNLPALFKLPSHGAQTTPMARGRRTEGPSGNMNEARLWHPWLRVISASS
jgi:NAD(P)-dependent dehydrogenase (short-subunit alcohol dehydrogenase family)